MVEMYQQKENALQQVDKEELERRSKENMLSEVGGKAVEAEEQVKVLRQRINEMEEQMKKTEEVYKSRPNSGQPTGPRQGPRPPSDPHGRYPDNKHLPGMDMMGPRSSSPANMDASTEEVDPQIKAEAQAEASTDSPEPGPGSFLASPIRDSPVQGPLPHDLPLLAPTAACHPPGPYRLHGPAPTTSRQVLLLLMVPPLPANGHPGVRGPMGPRPSIPPDMRFPGPRDHTSPPMSLPPGVPPHPLHGDAYGQPPPNAIQNSAGGHTRAWTGPAREAGGPLRTQRGQRWSSP
ncbi:Transport and Golgi organization protein 1-like protein [Nibea albiflora]|nr:Transport and Golgi organization protein 1-like protein [Nibea albiflora]